MTTRDWINWGWRDRLALVVCLFAGVASHACGGVIGDYGISNGVPRCCPIVISITSPGSWFSGGKSPVPVVPTSVPLCSRRMSWRTIFSACAASRVRGGASAWTVTDTLEQPIPRRIMGSANAAVHPDRDSTAPRVPSVAATSEDVDPKSGATPVISFSHIDSLNRCPGNRLSCVLNLRWAASNGTYRGPLQISSFSSARRASISCNVRAFASAASVIANAARSLAAEAYPCVIVTRVLANSRTLLSALAPRSSKSPSPMMLNTASQNPNSFNTCCSRAMEATSITCPVAATMRYRIGRIWSIFSSSRMPTKRRTVAASNQSNHKSALRSKAILMVSSIKGGENGNNGGTFIEYRQRRERLQNVIIIGLIVAVLLAAVDSIRRAFCG
jgi:hypothetical protein